MSIGILGAGAFGTALGVSLARDGHAVTLWARDPAAVTAINDTRRSPRLRDVPLPKGLTAEADIAKVVRHETLLLATPMQTLGPVLDSIAASLTGHALVACCKGIELATGQGPTGVIARHKPGAIPAILTGPSFAADIARNLPTALTLACADNAQGEALQHRLTTRAIRLYRTEDTTGAELGGALKNVIAIACGACIGAGLGDSARAALMTRGFAEMTRLARHFGARPETLAGLSGLGDLTLTCTSEMSRNFRYGRALGRGEAFDTSVTVEGAATARAAARLVADTNLPLPITEATAALTTGSLTVAEAMDQLLSRPLKDE